MMVYFICGVFSIILIQTVINFVRGFVEGFKEGIEEVRNEAI